MKRRYLCHNEHRFSTLELVATINPNDRNKLEVRHEHYGISPRPANVGQFF